VGGKREIGKVDGGKLGLGVLGSLWKAKNMDR